MVWQQHVNVFVFIDITLCYHKQLLFKTFKQHGDDIMLMTVFTETLNVKFYKLLEMLHFLCIVVREFWTLNRTKLAFSFSLCKSKQLHTNYNKMNPFCMVFLHIRSLC